MSESVWQHETDDDAHVGAPSPPAVDPLQSLQQIAATTDQPAAHAAAAALDALVKFLVTAAPDGDVPQELQPVAVVPEAVQPEPVQAPVVAPALPEPPPAVAPEPEPVAVLPQPQPRAEVVELRPSEPVDQTAWLRSDIDDALMPRSLAIDEQLEFMQNAPAWTPPVPEPQVPQTFASPTLSPVVVQPEPVAVPVEDVVRAPAAPVPAPVVPVQDAVPVAPPVTPVVPVAPVQQVVPVAPVVPVASVVPAVAPAAPVTPVVPVAPVQQVVPAVPVQQVVPAAPVAPAVPVAPVAPAAVAPAPVQQVVVTPPVAPVAPVAPAPVVVAAPVAVPEPSVPFWKRDVSLGKKKSKQPKPAAVAAPAAASVPFWKRELSLGKKKKSNPSAVAVTPVAPAPVVATASVPFWKRELSLGKKGKRPAATPAMSAAAPVEVGPPKPSVPFWKRELSLGKKKSAAPVAKAKGAAKEKIPFLKREIKVDLAGIANKPIGHQEGTTEGLDKLVGLRIGSSQLAAALVSNNGHASLEQLARSPLRPGIVVGGEVQDTDGLATALKAFFALHKLPKRGVRIGVATNRIGVRVMEVPAVDDPKAAANAIRFRAQEVLPFALSEAVVDHVDLGEGPNDTRRVLIAFAHRGLIDQYVEACKRAKLKLAGIDFDAFALLRAVAAKREEDDEKSKSALVALAIGHERTIFAVSDGDVCEFTRVLDWGGGALDNALAEALELTPEEAEHAKIGLSLNGDPAHPELTPEQVETARRAIRDSLQLLARELVASLQFYQSRTGSLDIGDVLVTGGGAGLVGLDDELTRMLGVPVRTADPFAGVTVEPGVEVPDQSGSLAIAVGLAIEDQH